ncbi:hypothetical protein L6452_37135 [Arctium lappa]|uniref:Uncharacterized protein n=1 Tax=Arctium lappa TaxID=4217 RepID=A0ACB8Y3N7_ARCLA|nr:hypothetical protein L6452_37135 [Arctium lappa]
MFKEPLGDIMEVYIDDMLVKSKRATNHIDHLKQSFDILKEYRMKLNPTKCSFGLSVAQFLGYMVTQRGIEANPDQIKAIIDIKHPRNFKEVQRLTGRVSTLNRLLLSLVTVAKKLQHYLESHSITVMTNFPFKSVLGKPELTGRLAKWSIYLSSYNIDFKPRTTIKSQALADFVTDFSPKLEIQVEPVATLDDATWTLPPTDHQMLGGMSRCRPQVATRGKMVYSIRCDKSPQGERWCTLYDAISKPQIMNTRQFYEDRNIKLTTLTPHYPQSNGLAKLSNKTIINSIKKRLKAAKGRWVEELLIVLWANRMTPRTSTGQTHFSLVYGCEAVLPIEAQFPIPRHTSVDHNSVDLSYNLDALEELRESTLIKMKSLRQLVERYFNKNVNAKVYQEEDYV